MRTKTINKMTFYLSFGAAVNFLIICMLINLSPAIKPHDFLATILFSNIAIVLFIRDFYIKHEQNEDKKYRETS